MFSHSKSSVSTEIGCRGQVPARASGVALQSYCVAMVPERMLSLSSTLSAGQLTLTAPHYTIPSHAETSHPAAG